MGRRNMQRRLCAAAVLFLALLGVAEAAMWDQVHYNGVVPNGQVLTKAETASMPFGNVSGMSSSVNYTVIMYDPDAPCGTYIHWIIVNITGADVTSGSVVQSYTGPQPPNGTGIHNYYIALYNQTAGDAPKNLGFAQNERCRAKNFSTVTPAAEGLTLVDKKHFRTAPDDLLPVSVFDVMWNGSKTWDRMIHLNQAEWKMSGFQMIPMPDTTALGADYYTIAMYGKSGSCEWAPHWVWSNWVGNAGGGFALVNWTSPQTSVRSMNDTGADMYRFYLFKQGGAFAAGQVTFPTCGAPNATSVTGGVVMEEVARRIAFQVGVQDIDECGSAQTDLCAKRTGVMCHNTVGSYMCVCSTGYGIDGTNLTMPSMNPPMARWMNYSADLYVNAIYMAGTAPGKSTVSIDTMTNFMYLHVMWEGLTSNINNMHIHGPTVVPLTLGAGVMVGQAAPWENLTNISGVLTAPPKGQLMRMYNLSDPTIYSSSNAMALKDALLHGKAYLNIHTQQNPGGELTGFYTLPDRSPMCMDINECAPMGTNMCDNKSTTMCMNNMGSYTCECKAGWEANNSTWMMGMPPLDKAPICKDINECMDPMRNLCMPKMGVMCHNTNGSYSCECSHGWSLTGNWTPPSNMTMPMNMSIGPDPMGAVQNWTANLYLMGDTNKMAQGKAWISVDTMTSMMSLHVEFMGLTSRVTNMHLHGPTAEPYKGSAGAIVGVQAPWENLTMVNGTVTGPPPGGKDMIMRMYDLKNMATFSGMKNMKMLTDGLMVGKIYFNVHTEMNPGGEINGFFTVPDRAPMCMDINECMDPRLNICDKTKVDAMNKSLIMCVNHPGNFSCDCVRGYRKQAPPPAPASNMSQGPAMMNGSMVDPSPLCVDIDECVEQMGELNTCFKADPLVMCHNMMGSFMCGCKSGWTHERPIMGNMTNSSNSSMPSPMGGASNTSMGMNMSMGNMSMGNMSMGMNMSNSSMPPRDYMRYPMCYNVDECMNPMLNKCSNKTWMGMPQLQCMDTMGSYACMCIKGFRTERVNQSSPMGGNPRCDDIDECAMPSTCAQSMELTPAGKRRLELPASFNQFASSICMNTNGSFDCACQQGFQNKTMWNITEDYIIPGTNYTMDGTLVPFVCLDANECDRPNNCTGIANMQCLNRFKTDLFPNGYTCQCEEGYKLNSTNGVFSCVDRNECDEEGNDFASSCDIQATCTNTAGSFTCACNTGFTDSPNTTAPGVECISKNECVLGLSNCAPEATCWDTIHGFQCVCNVGYKGDGVTCTDFQECTAQANRSVGLTSVTVLPVCADCKVLAPNYFKPDISDLEQCAGACLVDMDCAGFSFGGETCELAIDPTGSVKVNQTMAMSGWNGFAKVPAGTTPIPLNESIRIRPELLNYVANCATGAVCTEAATVGGGFTCGCPAGLVGDGTVCVASGTRGTYAGVNACPANADSEPSATAITDCFCRKGFTGANGAACTICPSGTYKETDGAAACMACPMGTSSMPGSTTLMNCSCPANHYMDPNTSAPIMGCPAFKRGTAEKPCVPCPPNSEAPLGKQMITDCVCKVGYAKYPANATGWMDFACAPVVDPCAPGACPAGSVCTPTATGGKTCTCDASKGFSEEKDKGTGGFCASFYWYDNQKINKINKIKFKTVPDSVQTVQEIDITGKNAFKALSQDPARFPTDRKDPTFVVKFEGTLKIDIAGEYTFCHQSSDSLAIYVNDRDIDIQGDTPKNGKTKYCKEYKVPSGENDIRVVYLSWKTKESKTKVTIAGPDTGTNEIGLYSTGPGKCVVGLKQQPARKCGFLCLLLSALFNLRENNPAIGSTAQLQRRQGVGAPVENACFAGPPFSSCDIGLPAGAKGGDAVTVKVNMTTSIPIPKGNQITLALGGFQTDAATDIRSVQGNEFFKPGPFYSAASIIKAETGGIRYTETGCFKDVPTDRAMGGGKCGSIADAQVLVKTVEECAAFALKYNGTEPIVLPPPAACGYYMMNKSVCGEPFPPSNCTIMSNCSSPAMPGYWNWTMANMTMCYPYVPESGCKNWTNWTSVGCNTTSGVNCSTFTNCSMPAMPAICNWTWVNQSVWINSTMAQPAGCGNYTNCSTPAMPVSCSYQWVNESNCTKPANDSMIGGGAMPTNRGFCIGGDMMCYVNPKADLNGTYYQRHGSGTCGSKKMGGPESVSCYAFTSDAEGPAPPAPTATMNATFQANGNTLVLQAVEDIPAGTRISFETDSAKLPLKLSQLGITENSEQITLATTADTRPLTDLTKVQAGLCKIKAIAGPPDVTQVVPIPTVTYVLPLPPAILIFLVIILPPAVFDAPANVEVGVSDFDQKKTPLKKKGKKVGGAICKYKTGGRKHKKHPKFTFNIEKSVRKFFEEKKKKNNNRRELIEARLAHHNTEHFIIDHADSGMPDQWSEFEVDHLVNNHEDITLTNTRKLFAVDGKGHMYYEGKMVLAVETVTDYAFQTNAFIDGEWVSADAPAAETTTSSRRAEPDNSGNIEATVNQNSLNSDSFSGSMTSMMVESTSTIVTTGGGAGATPSSPPATGGAGGAGGTPDEETDVIAYDSVLAASNANLWLFITNSASYIRVLKGTFTSAFRATLTNQKFPDVAAVLAAVKFFVSQSPSASIRAGVEVASNLIGRRQNEELQLHWLNKLTGEWVPICGSTIEANKNSRITVGQTVSSDVPASVLTNSGYNPTSGCASGITCDGSGGTLAAVSIDPKICENEVVEEKKSSGLNGGEIAGIVIGSVVGAALLACCCAYFAMSKKKQGKQQYAPAPTSQQFGSGNPASPTASDLIYKNTGASPPVQVPSYTVAPQPQSQTQPILVTAVPPAQYPVSPVATSPVAMYPATTYVQQSPPPTTYVQSPMVPTYGSAGPPMQQMPTYGSAGPQFPMAGPPQYGSAAPQYRQY